MSKARFTCCWSPKQAGRSFNECRGILMQGLVFQKQMSVSECRGYLCSLMEEYPMAGRQGCWCRLSRWDAAKPDLLNQSRTCKLYTTLNIPWWSDATKLCPHYYTLDSTVALQMPTQKMTQVKSQHALCVCQHQVACSLMFAITAFTKARYMYVI